MPLQYLSMYFKDLLVITMSSKFLSYPTFWDPCSFLFSDFVNKLALSPMQSTEMGPKIWSLIFSP